MPRLSRRLNAAEADEYDRELEGFISRANAEFDAWSAFCRKYGIEQRESLDISFSYRQLLANLRCAQADAPSRHDLIFR